MSIGTGIKNLRIMCAVGMASLSIALIGLEFVRLAPGAVLNLFTAFCGMLIGISLVFNLASFRRLKQQDKCGPSGLSPNSGLLR